MKERFDKARTDLSKLVLRKASLIQHLHGKGYKPMLEVPDVLSSMTRAWHDLPYYPVYSGASDKTVYSFAECNYAFRFWHDYLHILHGKEIDAEGEFFVAALHVDAASRLSHDAAALMRIETQGQTEHYLAHGEFPEDQLAFSWAKFQLLA